MDFNINFQVKVRLTPLGRAQLQTDHAIWVAQNGGTRLPLEVRTFQAPPEDAEGWSTWQLWALMHAFGRHLYNGCSMPFHPNIRLINPEPQKVQLPRFGMGGPTPPAFKL
jgi:hypothetical protein